MSHPYFSPAGRATSATNPKYEFTMSNIHNNLWIFRKNKVVIYKSQCLEKKKKWVHLQNKLAPTLGPHRFWSLRVALLIYFFKVCWDLLNMCTTVAGLSANRTSHPVQNDSDEPLSQNSHKIMLSIASVVGKQRNNECGAMSNMVVITITSIW